MYPKNALAQKANGPGLPPPLTKKTFYRKRLSHTLFSNQKHRNFSKLEFFLLKGHEIFSKLCDVLPSKCTRGKKILAITTGTRTSKKQFGLGSQIFRCKWEIKFPIWFFSRILSTKKFYHCNTKSIQVTPPHSPVDGAAKLSKKDIWKLKRFSLLS